MLQNAQNVLLFLFTAINNQIVYHAQYDTRNAGVSIWVEKTQKAQNLA